MGKIDIRRSGPCPACGRLVTIDATGVLPCHRNRKQVCELSGRPLPAPKPKPPVVAEGANRDAAGPPRRRDLLGMMLGTVAAYGPRVQTGTRRSQRYGG